ncbi:MAG: thymidine phosphorylase, partial [Nanoarchaeota archaeon]|nr:thymidine phosphorylase [Nanoarchaeota archaeon]
MRLKIKDMDIATGGIMIAILNQEDAKRMDLHSGDRILVKHGQRSTTAILDVAESSKAVPPGRVGVFEELIDKLNLRSDSEVELFLEQKPDSVRLIRKKLYGFTLTPKEMHAIVQDVVDNKLTDIELTYFIAAGYARGLNLSETVSLAKSMIKTGETLDLKKRPILDKHCIG